MVRLGGMLLLNPEMNYLVSIPVWFDWEITISLRSGTTNTVSIPVWFDWEY